MNGFDIIAGIPLLYAAYRGFRSGVVVQLCGIVGLLCGVYFAFRYGARVGGWLHAGEEVATAAGFVVVVLAVVLALAVLGRLIRGVFRFAGLGVFDAAGGAVFGVLKMLLVLGALLCAFETLNRATGWVESDRYEKAMLYRPLRGTSDLLFPYLREMKDKMTVPDPDARQSDRPAEDPHRHTARTAVPDPRLSGRDRSRYAACRLRDAADGFGSRVQDIGIGKIVIVFKR